MVNKEIIVVKGGLLECPIRLVLIDGKTFTPLTPVPSTFLCLKSPSLLPLESDVCGPVTVRRPVSGGGLGR